MAVDGRVGPEEGALSLTPWSVRGQCVLRRGHVCARTRAQESEADLLFKEVNAEELAFQEFLAFVVERAQDKETPEQVRAAFKLIAGNKVRDDVGVFALARGSAPAWRAGGGG